MQTELHSSLPLTLRLPIDGEPNECKQEAADSVVTATLTNRMVEMAEPQIADINRTAPLGGKPAERACGVNEGDGTEREPQTQLQQTNFYCEESHQHNANTNEDIPSTQKLPLEGEWIVYASGEMGDPNVVSEGCKRGTSEGACVDEADSNPGWDVKPADTPIEPAEMPDEPDTLIIVSIESEAPDSSGIPCVCLGGMRMRTGNVDGLGCQVNWSNSHADVLKGQTDRSGAQTDALNVSNGAVTIEMSCGEDAGMYLHAGDTKRHINSTDGVVIYADMSNGHGDDSCVKTNTIKPAKEPEIIRMGRKKLKPPDSPYTAEIKTFKCSR